MARYFIEVGYDGAAFGGFQIQINQQTIQGSIENALATLEPIYAASKYRMGKKRFNLWCLLLCKSWLKNRLR